MLVSVADVRDYITLNANASSAYSDGIIGSNVRAASAFLERATNRYFGDRTATLSFTTNGQAQIAIPGLRAATSVSQNTTALVANETYWLSPDAQQTGVYTGIQFRGFMRRGGEPWKAFPDWFDRNLDSPWYPGNWGNNVGSMPNDVSITGSWGYTAIPDDVAHATKVLAAYYTLRPASLLSGAQTTPDGNVFDLSNVPNEVRLFIDEWKVGTPSVVSV
jgi:hypothetical protein